MKRDATVVRRRISYAVTAALLCVGYLILRNSTWQESASLHTLMELLATLLALNIGIVALVRFYSQKDATLLILGCGFLGAGVLDGYHAVVSSSHFAGHLLSPPPSLTPWSWLASRLVLATALCLSWLSWRRERALGEAGRIDPRIVYIGFAALTIFCLVVFSTLPMMSGYQRDTALPRPQEFIPAVLFGLALAGFFRRGRWRTDSFEHWLILSLIVGLGTQALMASSAHLYDAMFGMAHLLKVASYICLLVGLLISMYRLFSISVSEPFVLYHYEPPEVRIVDVSQSTAALFGYGREEMLARVAGTFSSGVAPYTQEALLPRLEKAKAGEPQSFEWQCRKRNGECFWAEIDLQRDRFAGSNILVARLRDVTHRKEAEATAIQERNFSNALVDSLPGLFGMVDESGRYVRWNRNLSDLTGLSDEQLRGRNVLTLVVEADRERALAAIGEAFIQGVATGEYRLRDKGGAVRTLQLSGRTLKGDQGTYLLMVGFDVTEARAAEAELQKSRNLLSGILDSIPVRVFWKDRNLVYLGCNAIFARDAGFAASEEIVGKDDYQMGWRAQAELYRRDDRSVIGSGQPRLLIEEPQTTPEGNEIRLLTSKIPLRDASGEITGVLGTYMDITEHHRAVEALAYRDRVLHAVTIGTAALIAAESMASGLSQALKSIGEALNVDRVVVLENAVDPDGRSALRSSWQAPTIPVRLDETTLAAIVPDTPDAIAAVATWLAPLNQGKQVVTHFSKTAGPVRRILELLQNKSMLMMPVSVGGRVWGTIGIDTCRSEREWTATEIEMTETFADIVGIVLQRTHTRELLQKSEERFRTIFEAMSDAVIVHDLETGAFIDANPRVCEMYGYSREEFLKLGVADLSTNDAHFRPEDAAMMMRRAAAGELVTFDWHCRARDGHTFWVEVSLRRARFGDRDVLLATGRDTTEQRRIADALNYRDRILHAVATGTADLISEQSFAEGMAKVLKTVGEAIDADRVLILEFPASPGQPPMLRHSWQAANIAVKLDQAALAAIAPADPEAIIDWLGPVYHGKPVVSHLSRTDGAVRHILETLRNKSTLILPVAVGGRVWGAVGIDACNTEREWTPVELETLETLAEIVGIVLLRNRTQESLQKSEERFRAVSETAQDAIIVIDGAGKVNFWNASAERILGYAAREAMGKVLGDWLPPVRFREIASAGMREITTTGRGGLIGKTMEWPALRKNGDEIPVEISVAAMRLGSEWNCVVIMRDISERKRAEMKIRSLARQDSLTGLANRAVFVEALERETTRARRGPQGFAVLYLDLDHFKDVNDTLGHPVGDLLLQEIARRLQTAVRETDTVARFGGDEFAIIALGIDEPSDAASVANKILRTIGEPCSIQGNDIRTGTSIGIAMYGPDTRDAESLLSHADVALYRAKSEGRGTYRFFTEAMDADVRERVTLGMELREAIAKGQLFLVYQPQVDVETADIIGIEALVRWRHPTRGLVLPAEFIPVAEKTGLVVGLGSWVLHEACRQAREWLDAGIEVPAIAVNVSALQFKTAHELENDISTALSEASIPAKLLELELTESVLMEASQEHSDVLQRLSNAGVRIAIDDFGTGYSSLEYLGRFAVNRIKIAQSFIHDLMTNTRNASIVRASIDLAHELGFNAVVEGVETIEQLEAIRSWGARIMQGSYFSEPLSAGQMADALRAGRIAIPRAVGTSGPPHRQPA